MASRVSSGKSSSSAGHEELGDSLGAPIGRARSFSHGWSAWSVARREKRSSWKDNPDKSVDYTEMLSIIARFSIWDSMVPDAMLCGNPFATFLSF
jgi:hypothetical protein